MILLKFTVVPVQVQTIASTSGASVCEILFFPPDIPGGLFPPLYMKEGEGVKLPELVSRRIGVDLGSSVTIQSCR